MKRKTIDYEKYKDRDLSVLTLREQELLKDKFRGLSNLEIAESHRICQSAVSNILNSAIDRLDGKKSPARDSPYSSYIGRDLSILSQKEREFLEAKIRGLSNTEIARKNEISRSAVSEILKNARDRLDGRKSPERKNNKIDYNVYEGRNLSILTLRERELFGLKLAGLSIMEISKKSGISTGSVLSILRSARDRLDGKKNPAANLFHNNYEIYRNRDLSVLSRREKELFEEKLAGLSNIEISEKYGIAETAVMNILRAARNRLDGKKNPAKKSYFYETYQNRDWSPLSEAEQNFLADKINRLSNREIAMKHHTNSQNVSITLKNARFKLDNYSPD